MIRPQAGDRRARLPRCLGLQAAAAIAKGFAIGSAAVTALALFSAFVQSAGIEKLDITVREITKEDIKSRNLPNQTSGLVITKIGNKSPFINSIEVNSIILEAQKKKIRNVNDLNQSVKKVLNSNQKTILLVIYNSQNQRRYIGVKLD